MMDGPLNGRDMRKTATSAPDGRARHILAVAIASDILDLLLPNIVDPDARVTRVPFDALKDHPLSGSEAPALVLSPLVTPIFDAIDMARFLSESGFTGRYLALVEKLPSANLIRREVAQQAPGLNFDVIVLDGSSPLHSLE